MAKRKSKPKKFLDRVWVVVDELGHMRAYRSLLDNTQDGDVVAEYQFVREGRVKHSLEFKACPLTPVGGR